jgi:hypothetical protein
LKHLYKPVALIAAIILFVPLSIAGLVFNLFQIKKELERKKWTFWRMLLNFLKEIYEITMDTCEKAAVIIDRLGNIIVGDLIEYFVTKERDTTFGQSEWTISASMGKLLEDNKLTIFGLKFCNFLSKVFGEDHCYWAYEFHKIKESFGSTTGIS